MTAIASSERRLVVVRPAATPTARVPSDTLEPVIAPLLAGLTAAQGSELPRRIVVAAARAGDGATTIAACTAIALARDLQRHVLLIEANLARPGLARAFGMPDKPGLYELVHGKSADGDALRAIEAVPGLVVLPAGAARPSSAAEVTSAKANELYEAAALQVDHVVVDAAPLLESAEGPLLLKRDDTVVLVARAGSTPRADVQRAISIIQNAGARLAGVILNRCDPRRLS
ncbi:MAG TPA: CpsD/CapB family tyrosine-protein kinase [Planctomycetota bacterium]|nr:CpsD/CapB family tyrosine-protein kinase [Planctomycetota bacterium]